MKRLLKNSGFTLVELMVVVAIIGLLAAVAIPNFKKYQAKAKTSEAKLQLSALYTAESSFYMDYDSYATCLNLMGYDPSQEMGARYYAMGFAAGSTSANANSTTNGAPTVCTGAGAAHTTASSPGSSVNVFSYSAGKRIGGVAARTVVAGTAMDGVGQSFTAAAEGIISNDNTTATTCDRWQITEGKRITQTRVGF